MLDVLEEKGHDGLKGVEAAPGQEDGEADRCEDFVTPEGVGYECGLVAAFLAGHPINEKWQQKDTDCEKSDIDGLADTQGTGCDRDVQS